MKIPIFLLLLSLLVLPSVTQAGAFYNNPADHQSDPQAAMKRAWLVRVRPGENARFYDNVISSDCPALKNSCKRKAYLLPGDIAVAVYTEGEFTIVEYVGSTGKPTDGAIETRLLERVSETETVPQDWIGGWMYSDEQTITITDTGTPSILTFLGSATWGAGDPERVENGSVHVGSFAAYVKPTGPWSGFIADVTGGEVDGAFVRPPVSAQEGLDTDWSKTFPQDGTLKCSASFRLLGPYILAYTPVDACGGANVTFTGVYRKKT